MSLIENAPQKHKSYNEQQDHGSAAEQKGHHKATFDDELQRKTFERDQEDQFKKALAEAQVKYRPLSPAALEAEANRLLDESTFKLPSLIEEGDAIDFVENVDSFATETEYDLKSKKQIRDRLARQATLDIDYDKDDNGDSDYGSAIHVKNRL